MSLPPSRITTSIFRLTYCPICESDIPADDRDVPFVFTAESLDSGDPPQPICDACVEREAPDTFEALLEDRRRFHRSL
jgi:hypothetical protein